MTPAGDTQAICDFCSSPDVRWAFPCRNHERPATRAEALIQRRDLSLSVRAVNITGQQHGPWAACPACKTLIVRGDRDRLALRSAKRAIRKHPELPMPLGNLTKHVRRLHDEFWANREGPPFPVTPDWRPPPQ